MGGGRRCRTCYDVTYKTEIKRYLTKRLELGNVFPVLVSWFCVWGGGGDCHPPEIEMACTASASRGNGGLSLEFLILFFLIVEDDLCHRVCEVVSSHCTVT